MASSSTLDVPNDLANGNTADASEVMGNFTAIEELINTTGLGSNNIKTDTITYAQTTFSNVESTTSSSYSATAAMSMILCDTTSNNITVNLFAASGNEGHRITIKKIHASNAVTIDGNASETIDGATTIKLSADDEAVTLVCDGTNWHVASWSALDYKSATSSPRAGVNASYMSMTGNSVTLTAGSWIVHGTLAMNCSGAAPNLTLLRGMWASAAGTDSTRPAELTVQAGASDSTYGPDSALAFFTLASPTVRVTTTTTQVVYLVPYISAATASNADLTTYIYAERVR